MQQVYKIIQPEGAPKYSPRKLISEVYGLKWIPTLEPGISDDADWTHINNENSVHHPTEFSECNQIQLLENFQLVKDKATAILEIGVHRQEVGATNTSTHIFLTNKLDSTFYIGVDMEDKSWLDNSDKNIHTILSDSSNMERVMTRCKELGVTEFDFIFIDGWHSVNQVVRDWQYVRYLKPGGCVGFHDTFEHPGPWCIFEAIDETLFTKSEDKCGSYSDWGIRFAWKK